MYIAGNDGTDLALAAEIRVEVDGVPGSNDMPGRILLRTTPDGSQAPVDAVKIDSAQNVTVSAGNLVIGTDGKGIDFSATPGTGTSELLADYEEGTWTPTDASGAGLSFTILGTPTYVKVGKTCTVTALIVWPATASVADAGIGDLPFTPAAIGNTQGVTIHDTSVTTAFMGFIITSVPAIFFPKFGGVYLTNLELSEKYVRFSGTYITT
jgi:hypothetical protein